MQTESTTTYEFTFGDGSVWSHSVTLRNPSLEMVANPDGDGEEWTRLAFHRCPNCALRPDEHTYCPVARNLQSVNEAFCKRVSHEQVSVVVRTPERMYQKNCALQEAVSSLMGLIMATSGCPHLDKLRPMVFTHLPFATADQTTYRAVSMYLLAQYFRQRKGLKPDWELKELCPAYEEIREVNVAFAKRLASIQTEDANLNAVVKLDAHADLTSSSVAEEWWDEIEQIFRPHLSELVGSGV